MTPEPFDLRVPVDGETLRIRVHPAERARGTLLLVHGFLSDGREFGNAASALAERGWTAAALDLRGHGASTGPRGYASGRIALADMQAALDGLAKAGHAGPYGVVGHSAGGALALKALGELDALAVGVVVAPMDRIVDQLGRAEFFAYRVANRVSRAKAAIGLGSLKVPYKYARRYDLLYADPAAAKRAAASGFLQREADLAWYDDMMEISGAVWAAKVSKPTLVAIATRDRLIRNEDSIRVHDALAGEKRLVRLDSGHSAFGDLAWGELVAEIDAWFAAKLAR